MSKKLPVTPPFTGSKQTEEQRLKYLSSPTSPTKPEVKKKAQQELKLKQAQKATRQKTAQQKPTQQHSTKPTLYQASFSDPALRTILTQDTLSASDVNYLKSKGYDILDFDAYKKDKKPDRYHTEQFKEAAERNIKAAADPYYINPKTLNSLKGNPEKAAQKEDERKAQDEFISKDEASFKKEAIEAMFTVPEGSSQETIDRYNTLKGIYNANKNKSLEEYAKEYLKNIYEAYPELRNTLTVDTLLNGKQEYVSGYSLNELRKSLLTDYNNVQAVVKEVDNTANDAWKTHRQEVDKFLKDNQYSTLYDWLYNRGGGKSVWDKDRWEGLKEVFWDNGIYKIYKDDNGNKRSFGDASKQILLRTLNELKDFDIGAVWVKTLAKSALSPDGFSTSMRKLTNDVFGYNVGNISYTNDYNTGNGVLDFAFELVSDPLDWLELGLGGLAKAGAKNTAESLVYKTLRNTLDITEDAKYLDDKQFKELIERLSKADNIKYADYSAYFSNNKALNDFSKNLTDANKVLNNINTKNIGEAIAADRFITSKDIGYIQQAVKRVKALGTTKVDLSHLMRSAPMQDSIYQKQLREALTNYTVNNVTQGARIISSLADATQRGIMRTVIATTPIPYSVHIVKGFKAANELSKTNKVISKATKDADLQALLNANTRVRKDIKKLLNTSEAAEFDKNNIIKLSALNKLQAWATASTATYVDNVRMQSLAKGVYTGNIAEATYQLKEYTKKLIKASYKNQEEYDKVYNEMLKTLGIEDATSLEKELDSFASLLDNRTQEDRLKAVQSLKDVLVYKDNPRQIYTYNSFYDKEKALQQELENLENAQFNIIELRNNKITNDIDKAYKKLQDALDQQHYYESLTTGKEQYTRALNYEYNKVLMAYSKDPKAAIKLRLKQKEALIRKMHPDAVDLCKQAAKNDMEKVSKEFIDLRVKYTLQVEELKEEIKVLEASNFKNMDTELKKLDSVKQDILNQLESTDTLKANKGFGKESLTNAKSIVWETNGKVSTFSSGKVYKETIKNVKETIEDVLERLQHIEEDTVSKEASDQLAEYLTTAVEKFQKEDPTAAISYIYTVINKLDLYDYTYKSKIKNRLLEVAPTKKGYKPQITNDLSDIQTTLTDCINTFKKETNWKTTYDIGSLKNIKPDTSKLRIIKTYNLKPTNLEMTNYYITNAFITIKSLNQNLAEIEELSGLIELDPNYNLKDIPEIDLVTKQTKAIQSYLEFNENIKYVITNILKDTDVDIEMLVKTILDKLHNNYNQTLDSAKHIFDNQTYYNGVYTLGPAEYNNIKYNIKNKMSSCPEKVEEVYAAVKNLYTDYIYDLESLKSFAIKPVPNIVNYAISIRTMIDSIGEFKHTLETTTAYRLDNLRNISDTILGPKQIIDPNLRANSGYKLGLVYDLKQKMYQDSANKIITGYDDAGYVYVLNETGVFEKITDTYAACRNLPDILEQQKNSVEGVKSTGVFKANAEATLKVRAGQSPIAQDAFFMLDPGSAIENAEYLQRKAKEYGYLSVEHMRQELFDSNYRDDMGFIDRANSILIADKHQLKFTTIYNKEDYDKMLALFEAERNWFRKYGLFENGKWHWLDLLDTHYHKFEYDENIGYIYDEASTLALNTAVQYSKTSYMHFAVTKTIEGVVEEIKKELKITEDLEAKDILELLKPDNHWYKPLEDLNKIYESLEITNGFINRLDLKIATGQHVLPSYKRLDDSIYSFNKKYTKRIEPNKPIPTTIEDMEYLTEDGIVKSINDYYNIEEGYNNINKLNINYKQDKQIHNELLKSAIENIEHLTSEELYEGIASNGGFILLDPTLLRSTKIIDTVEAATNLEYRLLDIASNRKVFCVYATEILDSSKTVDTKLVANSKLLNDLDRLDTIKNINAKTNMRGLCDTYEAMSTYTYSEIRHILPKDIEKQLPDRDYLISTGFTKARKCANYFLSDDTRKLFVEANPIFNEEGRITTHAKKQIRLLEEDKTMKQKFIETFVTGRTRLSTFIDFDNKEHIKAVQYNRNLTGIAFITNRKGEVKAVKLDLAHLNAKQLKAINPAIVSDVEATQIISMFNTNKIPSVFNKILETISSVYKANALSSLSWIKNNLISTLRKDIIAGNISYLEIPARINFLLETAKQIQRYNKIYKDLVTYATKEAPEEFRPTQGLWNHKTFEMFFENPKYAKDKEFFIEIETFMEYGSASLSEAQLKTMSQGNMVLGRTLKDSFKHRKERFEKSTGLIADEHKGRLFLEDIIDVAWKNPITRNIANLNSYIEQLFRYDTFRYERSKGKLFNEANRIVKQTHFDYNSKEGMNQILDFIMPFIGYQYNNILFWADSISNNPRLARLMATYYKSNGAADLTEEDLEDNSFWSNQLLQGSIQIGEYTVTINRDDFDMVLKMLNPLEYIEDIAAYKTLWAPIKNYLETINSIDKKAEEYKALAKEYEGTYNDPGLAFWYKNINKYVTVSKDKAKIKLYHDYAWNLPLIGNAARHVYRIYSQESSYVDSTTQTVWGTIARLLPDFISFYKKYFYTFEDAKTKQDWDTIKENMIKEIGYLLPYKDKHAGDIDGYTTDYQEYLNKLEEGAKVGKRTKDKLHYVFSYIDYEGKEKKVMTTDKYKALSYLLTNDIKYANDNIKALQTWIAKDMPDNYLEFVDAVNGTYRYSYTIDGKEVTIATNDKNKYLAHIIAGAVPANVVGKFTLQQTNLTQDVIDSYEDAYNIIRYTYKGSDTVYTVFGGTNGTGTGYAKAILWLAHNAIPVNNAAKALYESPIVQILANDKKEFNNYANELGYYVVHWDYYNTDTIYSNKEKAITALQKGGKAVTDNAKQLIVDYNIVPTVFSYKHNNYNKYKYNIAPIKKPLYVFYYGTKPYITQNANKYKEALSKGATNYITGGKPKHTYAYNKAKYNAKHPYTKHTYTRYNSNYGSNSNITSTIPYSNKPQRRYRKPRIVTKNMMQRRYRLKYSMRKK